jgi:signal transduction histidine kinase
METTTQKINLTQDEIVGILETYSQAAERLKESHDVLQLEVRRLREELANKNRQLERRKRLAALGEMAAGLAHEIRNPLGGIQLYANLLHKDLSDRPEQAKIVEKIVVGVRSLDALVTDVLAMTHTVEPKFAAMDLVQVVSTSVELVQPQLAENESQISIHCPTTLEMIGDAHMLQRALLNLIRNAVDASGTCGQIFIDINRKQKNIVLQITDTGPGIDPEIADKIFNPFFTTKDTGTGLGLSIVHRIVEAHDGGAVFTVKLPNKISDVPSQGSQSND